MRAWLVPTIRWLPALVAALLLMQAHAVRAEFSIGATQVIYEQGRRFENLLIANSGKTPVAIQMWVDDGEAGAQKSDAPFVVSPPVLLLKPGERSSLQIVHNGEPMPQEGDSLYWLNLLEVPPMAPSAASDNSVRVALHLQLKLIYRPSRGDANTSHALPP